MWMYGFGQTLPVTQFVMAVCQVYNFDPALCMEKHVRWLYYCLEGGKDERGDWREMQLAVTVMTFFRFIKTNPVALLLQVRAD
jgi:hypothetical protein